MQSAVGWPAHLVCLLALVAGRVLPGQLSPQEISQRRCRVKFSRARWLQRQQGLLRQGLLRPAELLLSTRALASSKSAWHQGETREMMSWISKRTRESLRLACQPQLTWAATFVTGTCPCSPGT